jgi:hypothetical protein
MDTTKLTDQQAIGLCIKWIQRHNSESSKSFVKSIIEHWNINRMITRQQRMQIDSILWASKYGNKKTIRRTRSK